jgi:hypothetical protein
MPKKIAVLLATYGEVEEVSFKKLYSNSSRILYYITSRIANLPKPLQIFIATMRSLKRKSYWKKLGYRSKLNEITRSQAKALQSILNQESNKVTYVVRDAYYFTPPHFEDVVRSVQDFDAIITVPMIPLSPNLPAELRATLSSMSFKTLHSTKRAFSNTCGTMSVSLKSARITSLNISPKTCQRNSDLRSPHTAHWSKTPTAKHQKSTPATKKH